jgi:hypothetical protein
MLMALTFFLRRSSPHAPDGRASTPAAGTIAVLERNTASMFETARWDVTSEGALLLSTSADTVYLQICWNQMRAPAYTSKR